MEGTGCSEECARCITTLIQAWSRYESEQMLLGGPLTCTADHWNSSAAERRVIGRLGQPLESARSTAGSTGKEPLKFHSRSAQLSSAQHVPRC